MNNFPKINILVPNIKEQYHITINNHTLNVKVIHCSFSYSKISLSKYVYVNSFIVQIESTDEHTLYRSKYDQNNIYLTKGVERLSEKDKLFITSNGLQCDNCIIIDSSMLVASNNKYFLYSEPGEISLKIEMPYIHIGTKVMLNGSDNMYQISNESHIEFNFISGNTRTFLELDGLFGNRLKSRCSLNNISLIC